MTNIIHMSTDVSDVKSDVSSLPDPNILNNDTSNILVKLKEHDKSVIQALLFDVSKWTARKALMWLRKHDFVAIKKAHKTENFLRYRLKNPDEKLYDYRTIEFDDGIKAIVEIAKKK